MQGTHRHLPTGVGIYTMGVHKLQGTPAQVAMRAKSAGLSFIALFACWDEHERHGAVKPEKLAPYAAAFRELGIDVWVWGYPWGTAERIAQFVPHMRTAADACEATGIILDPELGFKAERAPLMKALLDQTVDSLSEKLGLGFTSFGITKAHADFPWSIAGGYGFGSPQLYTVPLALAKKGLAQWRELGWHHLVASVPTFGANSGPSTAAYASAIAEHCEGLIFWQWATTDADEWRAIEAVAKRFDSHAPERNALDVA